MASKLAGSIVDRPHNALLGERYAETLENDALQVSSIADVRETAADYSLEERLAAVRQRIDEQRRKGDAPTFVVVSARLRG